MTSLSVNNFAIQSSMQPAVVGSTPPYVPDQMIVPRYDVGTAPQGVIPFYNNFTNIITVQELLGVQEYNSEPINIFVPTSPLPTQDLWLYFFHTTLAMFDTAGHILLGGPVTIPWQSQTSTDGVLLIEESCDE